MTPAERARAIVEAFKTSGGYTGNTRAAARLEAAIADALAAQAAQTEHRACPCVHTTPCHDCCTDQQRAKAEHLVAEAAQTRALVEALEEACAWGDNFPSCNNDWRGEDHEACLQQLEVYKAEILRKAREWRAALPGAPRDPHA